MNALTDQRRQEQLRQCRAEYAQLKAQLRGIGFICEGSLVERWMPCGRPNCACAREPSRWHGPYFPDQAALYRQWVANRQRLQSIVDKMQTVSHKARRYLLGRKESKKTAPKTGDMPRPPR